MTRSTVGLGASVLLFLLSVEAVSDAAVISIGDLLFLSNNILLATSPTGVERARIKLASLEAGPLDAAYGSTQKRLIEEVYPGAVSEDGRLSFNPANFNRPVTTNTTLIKAYLIVTDLTEGKVKNAIKVPLPGLPEGTNFNFQADFTIPADQGDLETNLGYTARKYVAAGSCVSDEYSLFLVAEALSCKTTDDYGEPGTQLIYAKYTYNAITGKLTWSGFSQLLRTQCPKESKGLLTDEHVGRALGAVGSTGFFIAGRRILGSRVDTRVYKQSGMNLKEVFKQPEPGPPDYQDYVKLTLLGGSETSDRVKFAGSSKSSSGTEIRLFGYVGSVAEQSSPLSGFKIKSEEYTSAMTNNGGALYVLTQKLSKEGLGNVIVYNIGPFTLNVTGGKPTPTSAKKVFGTLSGEWAGSVEVVGKPIEPLM